MEFRPEHTYDPSMPPRLERLINRLVVEGNAALALPRLPSQFAYDPGADAILNDIEHYPQAFVLGWIRR